MMNKLIKHFKEQLYNNLHQFHSLTSNNKFYMEKIVDKKRVKVPPNPLRFQV